MAKLDMFTVYPKLLEHLINQELKSPTSLIILWYVLALVPWSVWWRLDDADPVGLWAGYLSLFLAFFGLLLFWLHGPAVGRIIVEKWPSLLFLPRDKERVRSVQELLQELDRIPLVESWTRDEVELRLRSLRRQRQKIKTERESLQQTIRKAEKDLETKKEDTMPAVLTYTFASVSLNKRSTEIYYNLLDDAIWELERFKGSQPLRQERQEKIRWENLVEDYERTLNEEGMTVFGMRQAHDRFVERLMKLGASKEEAEKIAEEAEQRIRFRAGRL